MKKWFFLFFGLSFIFGACKKADSNPCTFTESTLVAPAAEIAYLDSALTSDGVGFIQDPSGVFYTIDSTGTGAKPGICNVLVCTYAGNVMGNPVPFDSYTDAAGTTLTLGSLIPGWQKVMKLISAGSKVTLYIPPTLAYGEADKKNSDGDIIIPGHSFLKFEIYLINIY